MTAPRICPVCEKRSLHDHCERGCAWMKCHSQKCRATVDLDHRIAFRMTGDDGECEVIRLTGEAS